MLSIRSHAPEDYDSLPDIDKSDVGTLTQSDLDCLDELGDYIVEANAHNRFAATLLHSHFPISADETLVTQVDFENAAITLQPKRNAGSALAATNILFDAESAEGKDLRLVGLEFAARETLGGVQPIEDSDHDVLSGVAAILSRHSKTRRFGMRLVHDPLELDQRVLLETCDLLNRVLTCAPKDVDDVDFLDAIPTVFRWQPVAQFDANARVVSQSCVQFCKSVQGCVRLPDGHQGSSSHEAVHGEGPS